jgi:ABC-type bacteriocin/lantibiotic exporter with double-glycine peptidase domain
MFTSLALLAMVTHPANMVMTLVPEAVSIMANFDRLQNFLKQPSARDPRHISQFRKANEAASIEGVSINFPSARDSVLRDVSLHLVRGEIVICAGAVGSGKSTLATAVLGGIAPVTGSISVCSQEVAYCAQDPWLSRATIREAIIGQREFQDKEWYTTVIEACGLLPDFATFVDGDLTVIDNNGMNLSGGQKQRIVRTDHTFECLQLYLRY